MKRVISILVVLVLVAGSACLLPVATRAARDAGGGAKERVAAIQKACRAEFPNRNFFVDLNGFYARCSGRRLCNGVRRLDGGMLVRARVGEPLDPARCAAGISKLAVDHELRGVRVLYVQLPGKPDVGGERLGATVDAFLEYLKAVGVETLDLRDRYAGTHDKLTRWFFRTDHHWNIDAAFDATRVLATRLGDPRDLAPEGWTERTLPYAFLGSQGKRTGRWFAGVDKLSYLEPVVGGQCRIELTGGDGKTEVREGGFDVFLDQEVLGEVPDIHAGNAYKVYRGIGGITPCVRYWRREASNKLRVAVVGDSFVRPMGALLSAAFEDVMAVDPRYPCGDASVSRLLRDFEPDVLVVALNPFAFVRPKGGLYTQYAFFEFPEK